jgi:hypothetical protein
VECRYRVSPAPDTAIDPLARTKVAPDGRGMVKGELQQIDDDESSPQRSHEVEPELGAT